VWARGHDDVALYEFEENRKRRKGKEPKTERPPLASFNVNNVLISRAREISSSEERETQQQAERVRNSTRDHGARQPAGSKGVVHPTTVFTVRKKSNICFSLVAVFVGQRRAGRQQQALIG